MKLSHKNKKVLLGVFSISLILIVVLVSKFTKNKELIFLKNMDKGTYKINSLQKMQDEYEKNLNIKVVDFKWQEDTFEGGNEPKYLVFHHTASDNMTVEAINQSHKDKGWGGIGYHYYIRKDGTIYKGRPEEAVGAHAIGKNRDSIGICLEGNFENTKPTEKQINSLVKLSTDIIIKYNLDSTLGHKDVYNTLCPGKNFSIDSINEKIASELINLIDNNQ